MRASARAHAALGPTSPPPLAAAAEQGTHRLGRGHEVAVWQLVCSVDEALKHGCVHGSLDLRRRRAGVLGCRRPHGAAAAACALRAAASAAGSAANKLKSTAPRAPAPHQLHAARGLLRVHRLLVVTRVTRVVAVVRARVAREPPNRGAQDAGYALLR